MANRTRFAALGGALLAFALLFSVFFVALESDHDCSGKDCAICHQIHACQTLLEQLSAAHPSSVRGVLPCLFVLLLLLRTQHIFAPSSPVLWKVKLLN